MRTLVAPGSRIADRYVLERELGRGGMGVVWLAHDRVLERDVALKRIGMLPGLTTFDAARADREARLAAGLMHPHVVSVLDRVTHDGDEWLVMEHVAGRSLDRLVRDEGPLSPGTAAALLAQVADGLAAAHARGVVHRDVKPSNVLVTPAGRAKLTDFGIARGLSDATLTQAGLLVGSPAYLAPEVASGGPATAASDVWSLGATLVAVLTGAPPYDTSGPVVSVLQRIVSEAPPRPSQAGWLLPVLERAMERDPGRRWSAAEVRDALSGDRSTTVVHRAIPDAASRTVVLPPPVQVAPSETYDDRPRRRRGLVGLALASAAAAALATTGVLVALDATSGGDAAGQAGSGRAGTEQRGAASATRDPTTTPGPTPSDAATPSPSGSPTDATATADPDEMADFVADYLALASTQPSQAFAFLTPAYQQASGGMAGYRGFWDTVDTARAEDVTADPASLRVRFTMLTRTAAGRDIVETETYQLVRSGSSYLISGTP